MRLKHLLSVFLTLLTFGVGQMWGADATMNAGTNGSSASVSVGGSSYSAIKVGTSKAGGTMTITIPTGANKLSLYAAAWNGVSGLSLNITPTTNVSPTSIALTANSGIANNSPFTFSGSADSYLFDIDLSSINAQTTLTFTSSTTKRFVVWGAKVCYNPTAPTSGSITTNSARVSWTDSKNVNNYEVYYSTSNTAPTASSTGTTTTSKYKDLTSLNAGTTYYWWVRAYDSYCKTNWVSGGNFTTTAAGYTITAQSNNTNYGTVSGTTTITASPKSGYRVSTSNPYSISPANSATVNQNGNTFTVNPSANTTVTINFEEIPSHDINFHINGGSISSSSVSVREGDTYSTLPSVTGLTANCEYGTFVGWTQATSIASASTCPALVTSVTMSTSDVELYAVYSKTTGGGGASAGTIMFSENWTDVTASTTPDSPTTNGSSVYGSAIIGYNWASGGSTTQTYADGGPNGDENILVSKGNGYWEVTGIPTGGASTLTVSYAKSGSGSITLSTSTANVSVSGTTVTIGEPASVSSFDLKFENTLSSNCRIDDIEITVATAGSSGTTTYSLDANCCTPLASINGSLLVTTPTRDGATLSWPKVTNASGYEYKLGNGSWTTATVADLNNPSTSISGLDGATQYFINLRATGDGSTYCAAGSEMENAVQFKTLSRVSAAENNEAYGTAKVSLTSGSGWADYVDAADGTTIYLQATAANATYTFTGWNDPSSGSISEGQLTGWSGDVNLTANFALAELPKLPTPTGMASTVALNSATVSWNAVANATGYAVTCVKTSDQSTTGIVIGSINGTSCTISGLTAGTGYTWTVQALGDNTSNKNSDACANQAFTTLSITEISVQTAPTAAYLVGDNFNPAGLVITRTYSNSTTDTYTYADHTGEFTFSPATNAALAANNDKVTITWNGLTVDQAINVYSVTVNKVDMNGDDIDDENVTASCSGRTLSQSVGETNYKFNSYEVSAGGVGISETSITGTPTGAVTINAKFHKPIAIAWKVGTDDAGSGTTEVKYGTQLKDLTLPSKPDDDALSYCIPEDGKFMGWSKEQLKGDGHDAPEDLFTSLTETTAITSNKTFYAVFAKADDGDPVYTKVTSVSEGTYVMVSEKTTNTYRYMPNTTSESANPTLGSGISMSTTAGVTTLTNTVTDAMLWDFTTGETANYFYVRPHGSTTIGLGTTNSTGGNIRISSDYVNTEWNFTTSEYFGWEIYNGSMYLAVYADNAWRNYSNNSTNQNGEFYLFKQSASVSYSDYQTGCCTPLGTIDDEIALTNENCAAGVLKATWKMKAVTGIASQVLHIYKASDDSEVEAKKITSIEPSTSNQTKTISGLDNCTAYYVKVENISNGGDFCASGWAGDASSNATTKGYSYTINPTNVALKSGETEAENSCEDFMAEYVANTGYALPSTITVTGASDYEWEDGVLAIEKANVTGNVSVTITGTCITPNITVDPISAVYALNAEADPLSVTVEGAGEWCGYQWESKVGEGNWTTIPSATNSSYMPSTASAGSTTLYRVKVTNIASGCSTYAYSEAATISVSSMPICAEPTFSIAAGTKLGAQSITLSCETENATIYYTTNGEDPQEIAANLYSGAIAVNQTTTIKAIAAKSGMTTSAVVSATYTIQCAAPTFSVDGGTYNVAKSVELASDYGTVYYTVDGSDPATNGVAYSSAIAVETSTTIRAIAKMDNCLSSDEASAIYTLKCATPTFSVAAGTHTGVQNVELGCATEGAAIHYTTDNSTPTGSSATYSSAIAVSTAQTIKAIATKDGWSNSDVAEAAYTIQYTVTWKVGGVALSGERLTNVDVLVNAGGKVSKFPSVENSELSTCIPSHCTFMGWNASEVKTPSDNAPANMFSKTVGTIPTVSENVTYYAVFAEVVAGADEWVETALADLTSSDIFVLGTSGPSGYAMPNNGGTSAPVVQSITVNSDKKITSTVTDNLKWNVSGNATNGYTFYPNGSTSTWLYCSTTASSGSNNNIAIGTGNRKVWELNGSGYLITKDDYTTRYLSIYNGSDFRGYVNTSNGAFVAKFYKKTSSVAISDYQTGCCTDPTTALSITGATSVALDNTLSLGTTGGNGGNVTWSVTNGTGTATISNLGVLSPLSVGTVTVKAHQDETDGKCEQNPTVEITIVGATVHVSSVDVTPETVALLPGETAQLSTTVSPDDATDKSIKSWVSGTPATATVNASGLVTAVAKGTSTVTATTNDGDFADYSTITVHGITVLLKDDAGATIEAEGVEASASGKTLTASVGETKYVFKGWSYQTASGMTGFADASNASTTMTGTPNNDVVVIAEFYKPRVIKWSVNNDDTFAETTVAYDGSISSVPAVTSGLACASTFIAWTDAAHNNGETAKDDDSYYGEALYKAASDFPTNITEATTTYYAVFANTSGQAGYFYIGDDGELEVGKTYIFVNSLSGDALGNAKALEATTLTTVYNGSTGDAVDVTITSEPGVKYVSAFNENLEFECKASNTENKKVTLEIVKNTPISNSNLHVNGSGIGRGDGQTRYTTDGLQGWNGGETKYYDVYYNSTSEKFTKAENAGARVYAYKKQTASYSGYVTQCDMTKAKLTYVTPGGVPGCEETEVIFTKETEVTICGTKPTPPTGYKFEEWNTETDGSGDSYAEGAIIPATKTGDNITLTAQWTPVTYNITYHLDGGTNGANPATYTIETADIELVAATREHDRFDGWFTDNGVWENQVTTIALGSHVDIELYAKWSPRYEIQFKAADATVGTIWRAADEELNALVEGQGSEPSVTAPSLCGKSFAGWTKNQIEDVVEDAPADFMEEAIGTVNSNTTFYAVWADATSEVLTKVCDWESASIPAIWKASDEIVRTNMQGYDGTYAGRINTDHTYVQYNQKVNATEFSFAFVKTSGNDNYYVYIETSPDNSNWTAAETYEMSEFINGTYKVKTKTFDGLSKMYVRFHCYNTTAERYVDAVTIKYNGSTYTNYTTACHVTAASEQTVNVEEANTISSLTVKQGGKVNLDANLTVTDFTIEAMEGFSGQVLNPNNLQINGNAYYDLTLNTTGTMDNSKWYAFAVPFQVEAATGIQRLSNDGVTSPAGFNSHYVLLKYNSEAYASAGQGWEYVTAGETLYPGKFYMIALNSNEYNRVRMTKKADTPVNNKADLTLSLVGSGVHANWNALANNALAYANVSATGANSGLKVQVYNSATDNYSPLAYNEVTFTVGTPFFLQAAEAGTMSVNIAASNNEHVKAPARVAEATGEFQIRLGENTESYYDILYVSASEEALNEYQIGHDLAKAGVSTSVPQMYVPAYGAKLCDAEFPLVNDEATFPLTFTAPNAGTYQLYVTAAPENANLYLQHNGTIVWDLKMGAYALELANGTNTEYSLLLKANVPAISTGVDEINAEAGVRKILFEDKLFILRGGQMYDMTGKAVK